MVPWKVGDTFVDPTVPVVVWEPYVLDDMGMALQARETNRTRINLTIVDPADPLAAGLASGDHRVYVQPSRLSYGVVGGDARVIATEPGRPERAVIMAYEEGTSLADGTIAAGLRIGLFPTFEGGQVLTPLGVDLVRNAISSVVA